MSTSEKSSHRPLSGFFTALAVVIFLGGFYLAGSMFLAAEPWYIRLGAALGSIVLAAGALALTDYWVKIRQLAIGARIEMRKVFWPKKDELLKTTLMVLAIVAVFALFLTIVDALLTLLIRTVL